MERNVCDRFGRLWKPSIAGVQGGQSAWHALWKTHADDNPPGTGNGGEEIGN